MQGWLPLAVITIPLTIIGIGMLSGYEIARLTVLLSFSFYLVPIIQVCMNDLLFIRVIFQAIVSLSFVLRGLTSSTPTTKPRTHIYSRTDTQFTSENTRSTNAVR